MCPWLLLPRIYLIVLPRKYHGSCVLNNGVSIFKSDSRQEAHLPTKGDLKPTSYLCSTQKTLITAKKTQMGMVRLEIQHYVTTASNLQNKLKRSKATLRNPQINQTSSLYLKIIFQEYKQKGRQSYEPTTKVDISADAKAQGGSSLNQNYFHVSAS